MSLSITGTLKKYWDGLHPEEISLTKDGRCIKLSRKDYELLLRTLNGKQGALSMSKEKEYTPEEVLVFSHNSDGTISTSQYMMTE